MTQAVTAKPKTEPSAMDPFSLPMRRVLPEELPLHWSRVENGLSEAIAKCGQGPWKPHDVHVRLMDERAALWIRDEGFVIVEQCAEPVSRTKYLNVWVMWFEPGKARPLKNILVLFLDALRDAHDCAWWEFSSPRLGWLAMERYCSPVYTVWRRHA